MRPCRVTSLAVKTPIVVNFINIFCPCFSYKSAFCRQNVTREKHFCTKKTRAKNIYHKFHQHILSAFFVQKFVQSQTPSCRNNVFTKFSYVKCWWNWHLVVRAEEAAQLLMIELWILKQLRYSFLNEIYLR